MTKNGVDGVNKSWKLDYDVVVIQISCRDIAGSMDDEDPLPSLCGYQSMYNCVKS